MEDKNREYLAYIKNHKENVVRAWDMIVEKLPNEIFVQDIALKNRISERVLLHDNSKYSDDEFGAYRQYFYPSSGETKNREVFLIGWNHHFHNNDHHWEFWLDSKGNPLQRGEKTTETLIEMLCDWIAMIHVFGGDLLVYYTENKHKIKLLPEDHEFLRSIIGKLSA